MKTVLKRKRVRLTVLARRLGKNVCTAHRWRTAGRRGFKLECFLLGGVWYTTWEAVEQFIHQTTAAASRDRGETISVQPRLSQPRQRQLPNWTEQQLDRIFGPRHHAK